MEPLGPTQFYLNRLSKESIETLRPLISQWLFEKAENVNLDHFNINQPLTIEMSGWNKTIAGYAINYAVLLDDKQLAIDLCENGADLTVRDRWNANRTPLELALHYGRAEIARILVLYKEKAGNVADLQALAPKRYSQSTFSFWAMKEQALGREANFKEVDKLLEDISQNTVAGTLSS